VGTAEHGNEAHNPDFLAVDGSNSPTADINWGGNKITNVSDPADAQDAATKNYVDTQDAGKADDPHGNEAHSPDFLAADGTVPLTGDWNAGTSSFYPVFKKFVAPFYVDYHTAPLLTPLLNHLAFNTLRGGSVSFNPSPYAGSAENLFDGSGTTYVTWQNPSGTITVEVTFHSILTDMNGWGISFRGTNYATDFNVEVYDSIDAVWKTAAEISGNQQTDVQRQYVLWGNRASKLRFTFTGYNRSDWFQIAQIFAWRGGQSWKEYVLYRDGGNIYGNIDMNSNKITNLADPTAAQDAATKNYADGKLPLDTSSAIDAYMSGNKWLSVATSGIVGLPKQSVSYFRLGTEQSISDSTWTKVALDTVIIDRQSEVDTTNNRWTATEDGTYFTYGILRWKATTVVGGKTYQIAIYKNGVNIMSALFVAPTSGAGISSLVCLVADLSAGDYVELWAWHNSGAAASLVAQAGTSLSVIKVA